MKARSDLEGRRSRAARTTAVALLATNIASTAVAAVRNGGFEKVTELKPDSPQYQAIVEKEWTFEKPCLVPRGWTPNPYRAKCTYRLIDGPIQAHSGEKCIYIYGDIYTGLGDVSHGDVVEASVWARGPAKNRAWLVFYSYGEDKGGKPVFLGDGLRSAPFTVTPEWAVYRSKLLVPPGVTRVSFALRGEGVFFDDAEGAARTASADEIKLLPKGTPSSRPAPVKAVEGSPVLRVENAGFEEWQTLAETPRHWTLTNRQFSKHWEPGNYKGGPSIAHRAPAPPSSGGRTALFLRGQMLSSPFHDRGSLRRKVRISVRAKGAGGRLYVGLRAYNRPRDGAEVFGFLSDVIDTETTDGWCVYTGRLDLTTGPNAAYGRLQIEAEDVMIDDVRITRLSDDGKPCPMELALPVVAAAANAKTDGRLEPAEWADASELTGFANIESHALVDRQTRVSIMSDGAVLCLAFRSPTAGRVLRATVTERDGPVWTDDAVEIFVGKWPDKGEASDVYQFIVNPNGTVFDARRIAATGKGQTDWNCPGLRVATAVADGVWTTELAIPLAEVGVTPGKSAQFGLQLCRDLTSPAEWCSLTGQAYRSLFKCQLCDGAPVVRWEPIGIISRGKLDLRLSVRNPHAEAHAFAGRIAVTGDLDRTVEHDLSLAPRAAADLTLRCTDVDLSYGRFELDVADAAGETLFHQPVLLDTQSFVKLRTGRARKVQVELYPVQRKVNVRVRNVEETERDWYGAAVLTLYHSGQPLSSSRVAPPLWFGDEAHFTAAFADIGLVPKIGERYTLKAILHAADGSVTEVATAEFQPRELPWLSNDLGADTEVIPPFEPIRASGGTLTCWGRSHKLGRSGFPASIQSQGVEVLAAPIRLVGERTDGTRVVAEAREGTAITRRAEHQVQFAAKSALDGLAVQVRGWLEQDGMIRYEIDLAPAHPVALNRLSLEIPLAVHKYLHCARDRIRVNCEWIFLPQGDGVVWRSGQKENVRGVFGTFAPLVWVGTEKAGLCWFADNDRGWISSATSDCLDIVRSGGRMVLRVNLVAIPGTIAAPRHIVFGLQATPVRPTPVAPQHQMVMNYFGFDNPIVRQYGMGLISKDLHLAQQILAPRKRRGETAHVYMANDIMPLADPVAKACYYEWALPSFSTYKGPLRQFGRRVYGLDPRNYIGFMNGAVPSRIDYNLHCLNKLFGAELSGLYLDNSYPKACANIQHPTCAYIREDGQPQAGFNLFATRELVKRAAILAYRRGGLRPHVSVHMTDAMLIPCFSFAGLCIDGEDRSQLTMDRDFMDSWPLERVAIMGAVDWGPMRGWLPKIHFAEGVAKERPTRTMVAELKLFDMWIWYAHCNRNVVQRIEQIEATCGIGKPDTRFLGYWENESYVRHDHPDVKASFYVRPGKVALLYVSNLSREPVEANLALNLAALGLANVNAIDAESDTRLAIANGRLRVEIPWHDYRMVKLTPKGSAP